MRYYNDGQSKAPSTVVDFDLFGLPGNFDEQSIKRAANVKHVISSEIAYDNFTGNCRGDGRVKIRLNAGETAEEVRANFIKAGINVKLHSEDPRKKPGFTQPRENIQE